jgi:hypothetical protein
MNKATKEQTTTQGPFRLKVIKSDVGIDGFVLTIQHSVFCEVDPEKIKAEIATLQDALCTVLKELESHEC